MCQFCPNFLFSNFLSMEQKNNINFLMNNNFEGQNNFLCEFIL